MIQKNLIWLLSKIIEFIDTKKELINFDAIFDKADIHENHALMAI